MIKIKTTLVMILLVAVTKSYSQDGGTSIVYTPDSVKHINKTFIYPNGQNALVKDIATNFKLPKQAVKDDLHGKIFMKITIDTLGNASGKIVKG